MTAEPASMISIETDRDGDPVEVDLTACGFRWLHCNPSDAWKRRAPTTPFGRSLADACLAVLDDFVERTDRTFQHGGCAMLADALILWSGGRLHAVGISWGHDVHHVVAEDDGVLLDSDGRFDERGFAAKCRVLDGEPTTRVVPYNPTNGRIRHDAVESALLAEALKTLLPDPTDRPWRRNRD